jgi:predicted nucleic acid-binding Zn ribbon protein
MIYLYESVVIEEGDAVEHYEIEQGVHDLPLTKHPETGVAIRRVILGGWGFSGASGGAGQKGSGEGCDCGPAGCC